MDQPNPQQPNRFRVLGRYTGAVLWLSIHVAGIAMVWLELPSQWDRTILAVLWVNVILLLAMGAFSLFVVFSTGVTRSYSPQQLARYLLWLMSDDPLRNLLFLAFLVSIAADGRFVLAALYLVLFVLFFAVRVYFPRPAS